MIYSLTHIADLDGMASAAFLVRNYGMPISNIIFVNYGAPEFDHAMDELSKVDGSGNVLIITDFSMTRENENVMEKVLSGFKRNGNRVIWLDHHPWDGGLIRRASKYSDLMVVGENPYFCAAELVYTLLCKRDKYGDELARITHLSDFWLKSKSKKDNDIVETAKFGLKHIRSYMDSEQRLRAFVADIAAGKLESAVIGDAHDEYIKKTRRILADVLKGCTIIGIHDVKVGIGFGTTLDAHEACMAMIEKKGCDVGIYISIESMHGSVRSKRHSGTWGVDILGLAERLSGGGHPLAAGFSIEKDGYDLTNARDRNLVVERVRKILEELFRKKVRWFQQSTGKYIRK